MKKFLWLCLSVLFLGMPFACFAEGPFEVTFLHTSDIHAHLMPFDCASGTSMGGYARIKAYKDSLTVRGRPVVMLSSGDVFQGTLFYRFFRGIPDVAFMNQIGFAAMAVGNHEFDGGQDGMFEAFKDAAFPILSANLQFTRHRGLAELIKPSAIIPVPVGTRTIRLGIIGLTPETLENDVPKPFLKGIVVERADVALEREIPRLKAQGAELIVVLAHLGWNREVELAQKFPEISGMLGGHSHLFIDPPMVRETQYGHQFLGQSGEFGENVARYDVRLIPQGKELKVEVRGTGLIPMANTLPQNETIKQLVDGLWKQIAEKVNVPLGETMTGLLGDKPFIRERETNLGNLVADSMLHVLPADLAVINGGGVRSSIATGVITIGDCLNVLPFDNYLARLEMRGDAIIKVFNQVHEQILLGRPGGFGGFLHVSRGMSVVYQKDQVLLKLNGKSIDPNTTYSVITNDFLALGGNGLSGFTACSASETSEILNADSLMQYVKHLGKFQATVEGRILNEESPAVFLIPENLIQVPTFH